MTLTNQSVVTVLINSVADEAADIVFISDEFRAIFPSVDPIKPAKSVVTDVVPGPTPSTNALSVNYKVTLILLAMVLVVVAILIW